MYQTTLYRVGKNELDQDDLQSLSKIEAYDRGILYGDGIFETILIKNRKLIFFDAHIRRLNMGLRRLNITFNIPIPRIKEFLLDDILDAGEKAGTLRLTITRGPNKGPLTFFKTDNPTIIVEVRPILETHPDEVVLITAAERRNERSLLASLKTINFLGNIAAKDEALSAKADEALLLNTVGEVAECASSNLFAVINNSLITPPLESGILPGITRNIVFSLASKLSLKEQSRKLLPNELKMASEIFITNSSQGITPVKEWDGQKFPGKEGPIVKQLIKAYDQEIEMESR
ncbi:MAG: hypothetical protein COA79_13210 [Planctomycetota bacterium]|nr:MAG: hypothetical protein COA79_13210 [Planctomycetota bacterium]